LTRWRKRGSCHPDGPSYLPDGTTLAAYIAAHPGCLGTDCDKFEQFPILTKFIDAKQNLSVQVHPSNEYALKKEHQYGKTEMWYVLDCLPGAYLYYGFDHEISKEEFAERIKNNTLTEVLNAVPVHKGDCFFIPSGTLHAICQGIVIAEVQQNSNVTYRVYDYGRVSADGKPRALHIEKALDVTRRRSRISAATLPSASILPLTSKAGISTVQRAKSPLCRCLSPMESAH
jgi:mannose-6-phosphate isomerase